MDPTKKPPTNEIDTMDLVLSKLGDIERVLNARITQAHKKGETESEDLKLTHELLAKVVQKMEEVKTLAGGKDDTKMITLLEDIVAELKKKGEYEYEIEIDDRLREKLRGPQGNPGTPGAPGHTPEKGKDYLTEKEVSLFKSEIVSRVTDDVQERLNKLFNEKNDGDVSAKLADMLKERETALESMLKEREDRIYEQVQEYSRHSGGGSLNISSMKDVDFTGMQDGYVLKYSASKKGYYFAVDSGGTVIDAPARNVLFMNEAGNAVTYADNYFEYDLAQKYLDLRTENPGLDGALKMMANRQNQIFTNELKSGIRTQYLLSNTPLTDGYDAPIGSWASDNSWFWWKYAEDSTSWGKGLYLDSGGYVRNPDYPINGASGLNIDTRDGGGFWGDLLGAGDNILVQIGFGQVVFGNYANTSFYLDDASGQIILTFGGANTIGFSSAGLNIPNSYNFTLGTGAGVKFGTATNEKLGFWNATPIIQPTTAVSAATFVANTSANTAFKESTYDGYTMSQVVKALRNVGLLA